MKRTYEIPEMEIVCVEMEETIRTSLDGQENGTYGDFENKDTSNNWGD